MDFDNAPFPDPIIGNEALDIGHPLCEVEAFIRRFVSYPSEAARIAHVLWIAHTHAMDAAESTPRIAFLSPEPGSGKSRALEITQLLVPNPVEAINVSPAYLFRKVASETGRPTILFDEIDTVFGPKAKDNEETRGLLNAGHRKHSVAGRCVVRGKTIETEEIPAYCAVALAGLGKIPDTILSRSIVIKMRKRSRNGTEEVVPFRRRIYASEGQEIQERLALWVSSITENLTEAWPVMPSGIEDRDADVWEALLAIADQAGGDWPTRARTAARFLVSDAKDETPSLGVRLLGDLRKIFGTSDRMTTIEILRQLQIDPEAPWGNLRGQPLDAFALANILREYQIKSRSIRTSSGTLKGYLRAELLDVWQRYLPTPSNKPETSETAVTKSMDVSDVPGVTHLAATETSGTFSDEEIF